MSGPAPGTVQEADARAVQQANERTEISAPTASSAAAVQITSDTSAAVSLWSCAFCRADCTSDGTAQTYQAHVAVQDPMLKQQDDSSSEVQLHLDPDACVQLLQVQACRFVAWSSERQQACLAALSGCCMLASVYLADLAQEQSEGKLCIAAVSSLQQ